MSIRDDILDTELLGEIFARAENTLAEVNSAFSELATKGQMPSNMLKKKLELLIKSIHSDILTVRFLQRSVSKKRPWK